MAGPITPYLLFLIGMTTLGTSQFGFHMAELNAPEDVLTCRKKSISTLRLRDSFSRFSDNSPASGPTFLGLPQCIHMTAASFAAITSIFLLGGLLGALGAGPFASHRGRLLAMRVTTCFFVAGSLVETLSASVFTMGFGRFLSGIGAGAITVIVPLYISEVAPPDKRGFFGFFTQISTNVGILFVQTLGYFLSHDSAWRWILAAGIFVASANGLGLLIIPESPAWLAANGHPEDAQRILQRIRGRGVDIGEEAGHLAGSQLPSEHEALLQPDAALTGPNKNNLPHLGFVQVVKDPFYRPAIMAVVGVMFTQQFCGINSVIMYSVSLLTDLLPMSAALLTIIISVINLGTTILCSVLPDRLGRKTCLLISICGQGTSAFVLAMSIVFGIKPLSAVAVTVFVGFFAVGLGPVPFILASELVGQEAVGATQSWCLGANYIATFLVAQFFPIINTMLNGIFGGAGWVYFLFSAFAAMGAVFVSINVPETRGKKDADEVWGRVRRID